MLSEYRVDAISLPRGEVEDLRAPLEVKDATVRELLVLARKPVVAGFVVRPGVISCCGFCSLVSCILII